MGEKTHWLAMTLALSIGAVAGAGWAGGPGGAALAAEKAGGRADQTKAISAQTDAITEDVARLRGLKFLERVPVRVLSLSEFESMLREKIDVELSSTRARGLNLGLQAFGWVEPPFEIRESFLDLIVTQAAAVYDPETDTYLFIEGVSDSVLVDMISSHELVHAVTDQHFDLDRLLMRPAREGKLNEDETQAVRFLVEGDATYVMMMRAVMGMLGGMKALAPNSPIDEATLASSLRISLEALAGMPYSNQVESMLAGAAALGGRLGASAAALDSLPVVLVRPLLDAYLRGALLICDLKARGGWASVDSLYRNPPVSTEQVLHFDKLYPERDAPRQVRIEAPGSAAPGVRVLCEETLGELYARTLFEAGGMDNEAAELAAGWDGDRLVVAERDTSWTAVWVTLWDAESEASAFEDGLKRHLGRRAATTPNGENRWDVRGRPTLVGRRGDRAAIVQAGDLKTAEELIARALGGDAVDPKGR
jgi:hypothetical protein